MVKNGTRIGADVLCRIPGHEPEPTSTPVAATYGAVTAAPCGIGDLVQSSALPISAIGVSIDTENAKGNGMAKSFISEIELLKQKPLVFHP